MRESTADFNCHKDNWCRLSDDEDSCCHTALLSHGSSQQLPGLAAVVLYLFINSINPEVYGYLKNKFYSVSLPLLVLLTVFHSSVAWLGWQAAHFLVICGHELIQVKYSMGFSNCKWDFPTEYNVQMLLILCYSYSVVTETPVVINKQFSALFNSCLMSLHHVISYTTLLSRSNLLNKNKGKEIAS